MTAESHTAGLGRVNGISAASGPGLSECVVSTPHALERPLKGRTMSACGGSVVESVSHVDGDSCHAQSLLLSSCSGEWPSKSHGSLRWILSGLSELFSRNISTRAASSGDGGRRHCMTEEMRCGVTVRPAICWAWEDGVAVKLSASARRGNRMLRTRRMAVTCCWGERGGGRCCSDCNPVKKSIAKTAAGDNCRGVQ